MIQSETIGKLSEALAKAQGAMQNAVKDSSNPFFKSTYADLASVWDACRKPLSDNGLAIIQTADFVHEHPDMIFVDTTLCHSSGEWIKGRLAVKPVKSDPQSVGSAITYLRRYSLQSMVGIAPEDDDGNAASGKKAEPSMPQRYPEPPPTKAEAEKPDYDETLVKIEKVESKSGETNGKAWKAFFITTATGEKLGTFSETLADLASTYAKEGKLVRLRSKPSKKGREVVSIEDDAA